MNYKSPFPHKFVYPVFAGVQIYATHDNIRPYQGAIYFAEQGNVESEALGQAYILNKFGDDAGKLALEIHSWASEMFFNKVMDLVLVFEESGQMPVQLSVARLKEGCVYSPPQEEKAGLTDLFEKIRKGKVFVGFTKSDIH